MLDIKCVDSRFLEAYWIMENAGSVTKQLIAYIYREGERLNYDTREIKGAISLVGINAQLQGLAASLIPQHHKCNVYNIIYYEAKILPVFLI